MKKHVRSAHAGVLALTLVLGACIPIFVDGAFQSLRLVFELGITLPAGDATLVHTQFFPEDVKVKKNFIQISGKLLSEDSEGLPGRMTVTAQFEDAASGKKGQKISFSVTVDDSGFFAASAKVKKNISGGDLVMVTVQPAASAIPKGAELTLCVDLVKKKAALASLPACADDGGGSSDAATLSSLQDDFFTPTCSASACHDSAVARADLTLLAGESFGELVNVASTQVGSLNRVTPGDPENSYIIKKLRGDADISGERMPEGGPFLTDEQIDRFVRWIDTGAPDN